METKRNDLPMQQVIEIAGSIYAVAINLGIRPSSIYKWDLSKPPRNRCVALAAMTNGVVTKEQLRPDITDWDTNSNSIIEDLKRKIAVFESVNGYISAHLRDVEKSLESTIKANEGKLPLMSIEDRAVQVDLNNILKDRLASVKAAIELTEE